MFDLIDLIVGPLTEINPIRFFASPAYRAAKQRELGRLAKRILVYQGTLLVLFVVGVAVLIATL